MELINRYNMMLVKEIGISGMLKIVFPQRFMKTGLNRIWLRRFKRDFYIRKDTSDYNIIKFVLIDEDGNGEYGPILTDSLMQRFRNPVIIDGGANIGIFGVMCRSFFPEAKIIAIEPEKSNFVVLQKNTRGDGVICLNCALWSKEENLSLHRPVYPDTETAFYCCQGRDDSGDAIRGLGIKELMVKYRLTRIDLLKLDIEGAERTLFSEGCEDWLNYTDIIIIETHDRFFPGCQEAVGNALQSDFIRYLDYGENQVFVQKSILRCTGRAGL